MNYEPVIGLEVHIQLGTKSKLFCACGAEFGAEPNKNTCPVCLGWPGSLPVLNRKALEFAMKIGLALNCEINFSASASLRLIELIASVTFAGTGSGGPGANRSWPFRSQRTYPKRGALECQVASVNMTQTSYVISSTADLQSFWTNRRSI